MFDTGLLALSEDLTVKINHQRIDYLRTIKLGYGSDDILKLPTDKHLYPLREILYWQILFEV